MTDQPAPDISPAVRGRLAVDDPKYCFRLRGNTFWLHNLVRDLMSLDIYIFPDHEDDRPTVYYMTSPHLTGLSPVEATARAAQLLVLFNGVMYLGDRMNHTPLILGECVSIDRMQSVYIPYGETASLLAFPDDVEKLRHLMPRYNLDYIGNVFFLSRTDPHLLTILRILGTHGITLNSLSQVLDTVKFAMRPMYPKEKELWRAIAQLGGQHVDELESFTYTANNFSVSDVHARHGLGENGKPSGRLQALTLKQAADVILRCASGFVKARVAADFPRKFREVVLASRSDSY